uniref:Uncharacterized protein n=1 Tax=Megaselia scalaris TaxID=36166 RepID=T1GRF1_MEGSC
MGPKTKRYARVASQQTKLTSIKIGGHGA